MTGIMLFLERLLFRLNLIGINYLVGGLINNNDRVRMENVPKYLHDFNLFGQLDQRFLSEIVSFSQVLTLENKEFVFKKGESIKYVFLVLTGSVKIQDVVPVKKTKIFNFLGRGEFLGVAMAGLPNPKYPASAVCNEESKFLRIPLGVFFDTMLRVPQVRAEVQRQTSERFLEFQNDISKSHRLAPYRLADFLLRLTDRQPIELRRFIQIPLTRSDIAHRIGTENETVIRIMSQWTKNGWIQTQDRYIEIINRAELEAIDRDRQPRKRVRRRASMDALKNP